MAFQAQLSAQAGELVEALTGASQKSRPAQFKKHRDQTLRRLRHHNFLRTNQFEVEERLNGLEEIFRIQHREGLADALRERLDRLGTSPTRWHPDILHLLLELSDQPLRNTRLEALDDLKEPEPEPAPPLRWEDIAREDNWAEDPDLWKTIDYSDESADEVYEDHWSESDGSDGLSSGEALWRAQKAEDLIVKLQDVSKLQEIRDAQQWRLGPRLADGETRSHKVAITELQVIREVLFMLRGCKTSLFPIDSTPDFTYQLPGVSWVTYKALINSLAEMGRRLGILRDFSKRQQSAPHFQVFQDCVLRSLRSFDEKVTTIESRIILVKQDVVLSLVGVSEELMASLEPLAQLSEITQQLREPGHGAFRHLELLFQEIGNAQVSGRRFTYEFLGRIFFDCFRYYLRPIRQWMQDGQLIPGDKIFFVSQSATHVSMNEVWTNQFRLRRTSDGTLYAPNFLHPSVNKIFTAGKSIVILKHLGKYQRDTSSTTEASEPAFDFESIFSPDLELAPFAELFDGAFERWIQSKYQATSAMLKDVLFKSCGLWANLEAMQLLYFMSDGSLADTLCSSIFKKLDTLSRAWGDRYTLTSLAQEVYSSSSLDIHRLSVTVGHRGQRLPSVTARDFVRRYLPEIILVYNVGWPVQMILTTESLSRYKAVFTLLLQLRRAHSMLNKRRFEPSLAPDAENWGDRCGYYSIRSKLLWFCNTFITYLSSLVLAPNCEKLRADLFASHDVDAMVEVHLAFTKRVAYEACLGAKLEPIRECILDVLDLTIQLEKAYALNAIKEAEEMQEISRLSLISSPARPPLRGTPLRGIAGTRRVADTSDDEDSDDPDGHAHEGDRGFEDKPLREKVGDLQGAFEKHLKFISDGLRAVSRATGDPSAAKWDILAEMLEAGLSGNRHHPFA